MITTLFVLIGIIIALIVVSVLFYRADVENMYLNADNIGGIE